MILINKNLNKLLYLLLGITIVLSCNKKLSFETNAKHIGIPLVNAHLSLLNILPDSLITNDNNVLTLMYQKNFAAVNLDTLIKLPDTLVKNVMRIAFNYTFPKGYTLYSQTITSDINSKDIQLTRFRLREGVVEITYRNTIKEALLMKYTIKSATKNGQFLVITERVPAATSAGAAILTKEYDLSNYMFDLTGPNGNRYNKLSAIVAATVDTAGNAVYVTTKDSLTLLSKFKKVKPYYVRGNFGQRVLESQTTTAIDLFKKINIQQLQLAKASVTLDITNYTGIDAELKLKALSTNTATLTGTIIGKSYAINRATEVGVGQNNITPTHQTINISEQNTNIIQLLQGKPLQLNLGTRLSLSPLGNASLGNDFIYGARNIGGLFTVKIPLTFSFNNWILNDTLPYSIDTVSIKKIESGTLHFLITNTYPVDALTTIRVVDANNNNITTLLANAAVLGNTTTEQIINMPLTAEQLKLLVKHHSLIITTTLNTSQAPNLVSLNANAAIDVRITADFITATK